jgi:hypothetical protein
MSQMKPCSFQFGGSHSGATEKQVIGKISKKEAEQTLWQWHELRAMARLRQYFGEFALSK